MAAPPPANSACYPDYARVQQTLRSGVTVSDADFAWVRAVDAQGCDGAGPAPSHPPQCRGAAATVKALNASNAADKTFLDYSDAAIRDAALHGAGSGNLCSADYFRLWDGAIEARADMLAKAEATRGTCADPAIVKSLDTLIAQAAPALAKQRSDVADARKSCAP